MNAYRLGHLDSFILSGFRVFFEAEDQWVHCTIDNGSGSQVYTGKGGSSEVAFSRAANAWVEAGEKSEAE
jgi:hypothetical protein